MIRYQLLKQIGVGGMGTVYYALDTQTNTPVAVKNLKQDVATPVMIERFKREGELLRQLNHPSIVKMLDAVEVDGQHYLVMEYVSGGSLAERLNDQLSITSILDIALDLADALTRAHRLNVIHRDLKPANVLIADDGTPRLTDFGISSVKGTKITETGAVMGTLAYLSPEALKGETIDHRSDIWAFGVMLFEMLTGKTPFEHGGFGMMVNAILTQPVPDLEALRPDAPLQLIDLIYRMLAKNPAERLPSIRIAGTELEALLQNRSGTAKMDAYRFVTPTPTDSPKHNLPNQITPFVGREHELEELGRLIQDARLVTIVAMGGMGKTRLSLETAANQISRFTDGVYFVPLAPLNDPALIVQAIADVVQFSFFGSEPPRQQLLNYLSEKHLLLVVDNFEHLLSGVKIVSEILKTAPRVKVIATSRERLNLQGETAFTLSGMDFPDWETPADALNYAAVKLLMLTVQRIQPDFELQAGDLNFVARICRLTYGVPLAIELAAAWIETLPLAEIADEIQKSLDFLETELRDVPERQRSIRSVFDYSWNLLSDSEKAVFKRLSIFRGGFTRQAGQSVSGASLRDLNSLVNKSLVKRDVSSGRYQIHELLRQYAEEQLKQEITEYERILNQHCDYYAAVLAKREPDLKGERQLEALDEIELDFENMRAAWEWAVTHQRDEQLRQMVWAVGRFLGMRGRIIEGVQLFEKAQQQYPVQNDVYGQLLAEYGNYLDELGRIDEACTVLEKSLSIARHTGDKTLIADVLSRLAPNLCVHSGYQMAIPLMDEAIRLFQEVGDQWGIANGLHKRGFIESFYDLDKANATTEQSLQIYRQLKNKFGIAGASYNLGVRFNINGNFPAASAMLEEALALQRELKAPVTAAFTLGFLGWHTFALGEYDQALAYCLEAVQMYRNLGILHEANNNLRRAAFISSTIGDHEAALEFLNESSEAAFSPFFTDTQARLAYNRGDYQLSLTLYEQCLQYVREKNILYSIEIAYFNIARARIQLGDLTGAGHSLREGFSDIRLVAIRLLFGLFVAALYFYKRGQYERAVELATLVTEDKRTYYDIRLLTRQLLMQLEGELSPEQFAAAQERGKKLELDKELINTVLSYLDEA